MLLQWCGLSAAGLLINDGLIGSSLIISFAISSGNSITVTCFSVSATLKAFLITSVIFLVTKLFEPLRYRVNHIY